MKKVILSLAAASLLVVPAMAEETKAATNTAKVSGMVKLMHIVDGAYTAPSGADENKFDPSTGSALLGNIKFVSAKKMGVNFVANHYTLVDTGLTDADANNVTEKIASGMYIGNDGTRSLEFSILGEAYVNYGTKTQKAKVGRQIFKTPLTTIKFSTLPSFFEGASYTNTSVKDVKISAAHMTSMAYGARSFADSKLIGEYTNTAGAHKQIGAGGINQGQFVSFSEGGFAGNSDSMGMTSVGVDYTGVKGLKIRAWDYLIDGMANNMYIDGTYKMPITKGMKLVLGGQYLSQSYDDADVTGTIGSSSFSMLGLKAGVAAKKFKFCIAMNQSSGDEFVNVWGADPGYTSTIFSRNEYRKNVTATKITAMYKVMKGLKIVIEHADYGQSETTNGLFATTASNDATETDIIVVYKPNKEWMFKIFNAIRVSEYSDASAMDWSQNHIRMIATYKF